MKTLILLLCLLPMCAVGQNPIKTPVKFTCACDDQVGAQYAMAVRDLIASSPRYQAVGDFQTEMGKVSTWNYGIRVVSEDPSVGNPGNSTIFSIVITFGPLYVTSYVQICSSASVQSCASSTFADLDKEVSRK